jgi:hypothetical protein
LLNSNRFSTYHDSAEDGSDKYKRFFAHVSIVEKRKNFLAIAIRDLDSSSPDTCSRHSCSPYIIPEESVSNS